MRSLRVRSSEVAALVETVAVLGGILLFTSAKTVQPYMWAGVGLLAASFVIRWADSARLARRTPLDWPLLLFVGSALIGVWAAYDQPVAWVKFLHILGGVALYYLLASRAGMPWFGTATILGLTLAGSGLALYFITQFDYGAQAGKFDEITRLGVWISGIAPRLPGQLPHPNIIAGTLAVILPLSVAAAIAVRHKVWRAALASSSLVMLAGVIMTTSRGAWLALAAVGVAALALAWGRQRVPERWQGRVVVAALLVLCVVAVAVLVSPADLVTQALGSIPGGDRAIGRGELYGQAWGLIKDYFFTGSGLGMFGMVYSTYVLLIWVHFLGHAHNFFLQVWIEQGIVGFVAIAWLVAAFYVWAWRWRKGLTWLGWGALAAATVMLLHGLVDNPLYSFRVLPLIFVPLGMVAGQGAKDRGPGSGVRGPGAGSAGGKTGAHRWLGFGLTVVVAAAGMMAEREQVLGMWYANLGSVAQTKAELKDYQFPERLVDYVRHDGDMSVPEAYFQQALAHDTTNVTARQRLAELALGRSEHDLAGLYLEPIAAGPSTSPITRQLLCEADLGLGRSDDAYTLCASVPGAAVRLDGVASVRYDRYQDALRARWARDLAERIRQANGGQ